MRRALFLFASLALLFTLGLTPVAHAAEPLACVEILGDPDLHTLHDGDEVPADAEKSYPHHHGNCHGQHVAPPLVAAEIFAGRARLGSHESGRAARLTPTSTDLATRPPIA